jgi:hypothetical protein
MSMNAWRENRGRCHATCASGTRLMHPSDCPASDRHSAIPTRSAIATTTSGRVASCITTMSGAQLLTIRASESTRPAPPFRML